MAISIGARHADLTHQDRGMDSTGIVHGVQLHTTGIRLTR